ncbi:MAG: hypothetical protein ACPGUV_03050 [Polyangiales bacterium]
MSDYLRANPDLADFVQALAKHNVAFLVVGGHALGVHTKPRATKDLDVWLEPSVNNRQRVAAALQAYGTPPSVQQHLLLAKEADIVWFGRPPNRIDMMFELPGVDFGAALQRAVRVPSGDQLVAVIGLEDLIRNKQTVGRPQDLLDVQALRSARGG